MKKEKKVYKRDKNSYSNWIIIGIIIAVIIFVVLAFTFSYYSKHNNENGLNSLGPSNPNSVSTPVYTTTIVSTTAPTTTPTNKPTTIPSQPYWHCDPANDQCAACTSCDPVTKTCWPKPTGTVDPNCPKPNQKCTATANCPCDPTHKNPTVDGWSSDCNGLTDPPFNPSGPKCDPKTGNCGCTSDSDCTAPGAGLKCIKTGTEEIGKCVKCTSNSDCESYNNHKDYCDTTTGRCGECAKDSDCSKPSTMKCIHLTCVEQAV